MDRQACHSSRPLIPNETAQHGFTSRVESFAGEVEATAIGADRSKLHVTPPAAVPALCVGPGIVIARANCRATCRAFLASTLASPITSPGSHGRATPHAESGLTTMPSRATRLIRSTSSVPRGSRARRWRRRRARCGRVSCLRANLGPALAAGRRPRGDQQVAIEMLQNERLGANVEQVLDESRRWQEHVAFIVMFRFDYDAAGYERQVTADPRPPEQVALRGADNPVLWWWSSLFFVSAGNLIMWVVIAREVHGLSDGYVAQQLSLSGIFAAACAFRSILPRVDLERLCLWNSPLSSIFVGRSVATVAELAFAGQCALLISKLSALTGNAWVQVVGWWVVPLIVLAQLCCWHAVISLNHLGHAIEEILWSVLAFLVALSLGLSAGQMPADSRILSRFGMVACAGAALLMLAVDVPMYLARWRHARSNGIRYLSMMEGLRDALQRRRVAHRWCDWRPEVPWMSLYFSVGVWLSLCFVFV